PPLRSGQADFRPLFHRMRSLDRLQHEDPGARRAAEAIGRAPREKSLVAALELHEPHPAALRGSVQYDGPLDAGRRDVIGRIELDEVDLDAAVHDDDRLVVRSGEPRRSPLRAERLDDVTQIPA